MKIDENNLLSSILESLSKVDYIRSGDIPNIDLYMDQVTTFMNKELASTKRLEEDKILTKTMINNYTKNNLLPPPVKKKYSRDHVLMLIFIYYFKNILSIRDIETILSPLSEKYFSDKNEISLTSVYEEVCRLEKSRIEAVGESVKEACEKSSAAFSDLPSGEDQDELRLFAFICSLSFDVYLKKMMIEKIIDNLKEKKEHTENNNN